MRIECSVLLARQQESGEPAFRMGLILAYALGLLAAAGCVYCLQCQELCTNDFLGCSDDALPGFHIVRGTAGVPSGDTVSDDGLCGTPVKVLLVTLLSVLGLDGVPGHTIKSSDFVGVYVGEDSPNLIGAQLAFKNIYILLDISL